MPAKTCTCCRLRPVRKGTRRYCAECASVRRWLDGFEREIRRARKVAAVRGPRVVRVLVGE